MAGNVLITIVIASYNSGATIRKALQSVKDQSFQNWECLVVDGASRDDTIEIVREFVDEDPRFRYISEPDKGIYDAFNKGWKNAKGEWVYYLGSDDWLTKDGMNDLSCFTNTDAAILSGDVYVNHLDSHSTLRVAKDGKPDFGYHQGMIMRRSTLERFNGFDMKYKILADYDLLVRIVNEGGKLQLVKTVPIAYFSQGGTTSQISTLYRTIKDRYDIYVAYSYVKHPFLSILNYTYHKVRSMIYRGIRKKLRI